MFDPEDDFNLAQTRRTTCTLLEIWYWLLRGICQSFYGDGLMEHEYFDGVDWDAVYNLKIQPPKSSALSGKSSHERDIPRTGLRRFTEEDSSIMYKM